MIYAVFMEFNKPLLVDFFLQNATLRIYEGSLCLFGQTFNFGFPNKKKRL